MHQHAYDISVLIPVGQDLSYFRVFQLRVGFPLDLIGLYNLAFSMGRPPLELGAALDTLGLKHILPIGLVSRILDVFVVGPDFKGPG